MELTLKCMLHFTSRLSLAKPPRQFHVLYSLLAEVMLVPQKSSHHLVVLKALQRNAYFLDTKPALLMKNVHYARKDQD